MASVGRLEPGDLIERRYLGLARLAGNTAVAGDWRQLAAAVSNGLREPLEAATVAPGVRVWGVTSEGFEELARHPAEAAYGQLSPDELQRAAQVSEPMGGAGGRLLVGLHVAGVSLGVLDVEAASADAELLFHAAPIVACRMSMLGGHGVGDVLLAPFAIEGGGDTATLMARFAAEAKRLLEHDRLSAYLLTQDGRAFERFAVATSRTLRGEGIVIPFEDVGLRHIVITNRALVSQDLAEDPRIVGREDRVIARAGFHGLLSVPLRRNGRPFGVLNFVSRTPGFYRDEDIPIAQQIADQVSAFIENLYVERRMRALFRHEAAERERARVAGDVYQVISQTVPEIEAVATELRDGLAGRDESAAAKAERVRELARLELADVRRAVAGLAPQALGAHSLREAVEQALADFNAAGGPQARMTVQGDPSNHSAAARRAAFRIFQEALTNVRLHAQASAVEVSISAGRDLELTIADDGVGFDPETGQGSLGLGIQFMRERAERLGGTLAVESAPDAGTLVRFELLGARDATDQSLSADELEAAGPGGATLRVFVIERHPLLRSGLARLAERSGDMRVVGEAEAAGEARGQLKRLRPDVVLLDARLGDQLDVLLRELRMQLPGTAALVLSEHQLGREAELLEAGAAGVAYKSTEPEELAELIRSVAGGARLAPIAPPAAGDPGDALTDRERSILELVTTGETNTEIGEQLFLATKTVERQVATVVRKLGARNRAQAAAIAVARGLVDLPPGDWRA